MPRRSLLPALALWVAACQEQPTPLPTSSVDSGAVVVDGVSLPYLVEGTGRPCLVFGSHLYYPRTFSAGFKQQLRCVHVDQRGFLGDRVPATAGQYSVERAVADLEAVRTALGLERVIVVGHSMHGAVALAYALAHPERTAGVIAIGAPPTFDSTLAAATASYWEQHASAGRKAFDAANPLRIAPDSVARLGAGAAMIAAYVGNGARYWADSAYDASALWQGMEPNPTVVFQLFDATKPFRLPTTIAPNAPPALIALGRFDYVVPPTLWEGRPLPFEKASLVFFEKSGHTPQLEEPAAFDAAVRDWLATVR